ncbi:MAG: hypothetical protein J6W40_02345 [Alphaproteobacteria bacterium]|nr:hypothetical protein [Alphaproteobacteria bacterium]
MNEDEKMFQIGVWALIIMAVLTVILQVCYRTQNRVLNRVRADIIQTKQNIAVAETDFAAYVRPEILGSVVKLINPKAETVGFQKNISINELPERK